MLRSSIAGLAVVYLIALVDLTLVRFPQPGPPPNLVPMRTIAACLGNGRSGAINLVGNLVLLVPVGSVIAMVVPGRIGAGLAVLSGLVLSSGIELAQFACGHRTADVDDVMLNAFGALLGFSTVAVARRAAMPGGATAAGPSR